MTNPNGTTRPGRLAALLLLAGACLSACSPAGLLNATVPNEGVTVQHDIPYAPEPRHTMDIYQPRPAAPSTQAAARPLVVFLYGGGWTAGSKEMFEFVARPLAARGAVVVVPDYRLAPGVRWPVFLDDNAEAVAWAVTHAADLGADPRRIFVVGHSAGAYDALMLATDPSYLRRAGTSRDRLAGVVGLAGPYAFLPSGDPSAVAAFGPAGRAANIPANQPAAHVDGHAPPLLLIAGTDDTTVQPRNTAELTRLVAAAGGTVESKLYPGIGHVGLVLAFAPVFSGRAPVLDDVWAFVSTRSIAPP